MVVDTSALVCVLLGEPEAAAMSDALFGGRGVVSAATLVEARVVALRRGGEAMLAGLENLLAASGTRIEPLSVEQALIAGDAYRVFGKGRHPAKLGFGDTFAYALAMDRGEPLLFKGADFAATDVTPAI